jgi:serine/threonine-protein phosphatase 2A regulatory subunit A
MAVDFDPLEFFYEEIKSTEKTVRLNAIKNVKQIAYAIGAQKTMAELIPGLAKAMETEPGKSDEEFLYTIAEQAVELRGLNPGLPIVEKLVPILAALCEQEETVVHDRAVLSLCKIMEDTTAAVPDCVKDLLFPRLKELAEKDWFTGRVSACGLFPTAYKHGTEEQKTLLRKMYGTLCGSEETPMVRRAAAAHLKDFVAVIEKQGLLQDMIPIYKALSQEETQDTIRISCLQTALVIAKAPPDVGLGPDDLKTHIVGVVVHAVDDRSWRVRLTLAKNFDALCKAFGTEITAHFFIDPLVQLLKDQEVEVRTQALKIIDPCLEILTLDQLQNFIVPELNRFLTDQAHQVRAAVAALMGPLAKTLGRDQTLKLLLPLAMDLMKDEFHEVRLNMVGNTATVCEVMGLNDQTQSFVNSIQDLIMDNQWRVRSAVIQQVPRLAVLFGHQMFQQSKNGADLCYQSERLRAKCQTNRHPQSQGNRHCVWKPVDYFELVAKAHRALFPEFWLLPSSHHIVGFAEINSCDVT